MQGNCRGHLVAGRMQFRHRPELTPVAKVAGKKASLGSGRAVNLKLYKALQVGGFEDFGLLC